MKKNLILAGMMMVSTIIFAQHGKHAPSAKTGKKLEKLKTELLLTDDQYVRVKAINEKFAASYTKLKKDTAMSVGTSQKQHVKLRTDQEAQIKSVLNEPQLAKWNSMTKKKNGRGKHGRDKHRRDHKG
ncbi:MAG: hypothetical protein HOP08_09320 [Cyclobacteriaceae bacterium]|nr:hypothetical protein [Cyclobacteriaceae bacterium]